MKLIKNIIVQIVNLFHSKKINCLRSWQIHKIYEEYKIEKKQLVSIQIIIKKLV